MGIQALVEREELDNKGDSVHQALSKVAVDRSSDRRTSKWPRPASISSESNAGRQRGVPVPVIAVFLNELSDSADLALPHFHNEVASALPGILGFC